VRWRGLRLVDPHNAAGLAEIASGSNHYFEQEYEFHVLTTGVFTLMFGGAIFAAVVGKERSEAKSVSERVFGRTLWRMPLPG
jgi:hypothetical protein